MDTKQNTDSKFRTFLKKRLDAQSFDKLGKVPLHRYHCVTLTTFLMEISASTEKLSENVLDLIGEFFAGLSSKM